MGFNTVAILSLTLAVSVQIACDSDEGCQPWYSNQTGVCRCGSDFEGRLICHDWNQTVDISAGFCITYDAKREHTKVNTSGLVVGDCPYGYVSNNILNRKFSRVPTNVSDINRTQCDPYKRKGLFCGECMDGYGPAAYTFQLQCANCSHLSPRVAVVLSAVLEILPVTVFFVIVLIFRFNLMTGPMLGYVLFCQSIINTLQYSKYLYFSIFHNLPRLLSVLGHFSLSLSGVWNLKFFQFIIPPFCISERLTDIHLHMLGFTSGFYPLALVLISYFFVELSGRCRILYRCGRILNTYSMGHSIIHAFATFTMLSMFSTICQGYAILQISRVQDMNGNVLKTVLYIYPKIVSFSPTHLPYLFASLIFVFILVTCPALLLLVYPTRLYTKFSNYLSVRKQLTIKIFAETVHGEFKDGLNNTRDYRMLPPLFILLGLLFSLLMSLLPHYGWDGFPPLTISSIFALSSYTVAFLRPCKTLLANMSLSFHLLLVGIVTLLGTLWWQDLILKSYVVASAIVIAATVPHVLMGIWAVHCILKYTYGLQVYQQLYNKLCHSCNKNRITLHYSHLYDVAVERDK